MQRAENNSYEFEARVRYSEIDHRGTLTLPALINYFQDCSTFHSETVGLGMDHLRQKKKAWVLSYWQIIADRYPKLSEKITVGTFATEFKGLFGNRNFYMKDEAGNLAACAYSWISGKGVRAVRQKKISLHTGSMSRWTCPMRDGRLSFLRRWMTGSLFL